MFAKTLKDNEVCPGKPAKMKELMEVEGLEGLVADQGWENIFSYTRYCPDMVSYFFTNLWLSSNKDDEP